MGSGANDAADHARGHRADDAADHDHRGRNRGRGRGRGADDAPEAPDAPDAPDVDVIETEVNGVEIGHRGAKAPGERPQRFLLPKQSAPGVSR